MVTVVEDSGYARAPELDRITELESAWAEPSAGARLRAVRAAAEPLRARVAEGPRALCLRSLPIATLAHPTRFAFHGAALSPAPFVVLTHRATLVQFLQRGEPKTLLFNPTDDVAARATPCFERLIRQFGDYLAFQVLQHRYATLERQLAAFGLGADDIDYLAFGNLQHQDLRPLLGTSDGAFAARFSRARLLASRSEWEDWDDLHPEQRFWYVADGKRGVDRSRVVLVDGDLELGGGALLLATPGATSGNRTLFVNTADGLWGISNNGVAADSWSPLDSRIKGLATASRRLDIDVLPSSASPERGADQYTSMILERTLTDRVRRAPAFSQLFPSSEVTPSRLSPGLRPTVVHGNLAYGKVVEGAGAAEASRVSRARALAGVATSAPRP
ncbi:MAG: hypothetical protein OZ921_14795 [Sorangiineae bacterium]|nr:hypothetical protein [Polyangiaceae bacterium]MEB2323777.1 hypothetical protein [Sorangiineae bacterium]